MKIIVLFFLLVSSSFAVSYSTFLKDGGDNYKNSDVSISGLFSSYRCVKDRKINGNRVDGYCKVQLKAMDNNKFIGYVAVYVGTTWQSDFRNATRNDIFSFSCTYRNSMNIFKDCR